MEQPCLSVLTDIMREFALEIGSEIKRNAEVGMRAQPNLVDALNTSLDYGYNKNQISDIIQKSELSLVPYKQTDYTKRQKQWSELNK